MESCRLSGTPETSLSRCAFPRHIYPSIAANHIEYPNSRLHSSFLWSSLYPNNRPSYLGNHTTTSMRKRSKEDCVHRCSPKAISGSVEMNVWIVRIGKRRRVGEEEGVWREGSTDARSPPCTLRLRCSDPAHQSSENGTENEKERKEWNETPGMEFKIG